MQVINKHARLFLPIPLAILLLTALVLSFREGSTRSLPGSQIDGVVQDANGPLLGAEIRIRATSLFTYSDENGLFSLRGLTTGITLPLTAWADGYYITQTMVIPPAAGITLTLSRYPASDNPDYDWIYPHRADSPPEVNYGCDTCHAGLIVAQWEGNAHSLAARDPRFLSLYNGTDLTGTQTVAPGFALDFLGINGNCATCHAPGAAANAPFNTDINALVTPESNGVFCDFCHKTGGVYLNPATGLPYPNMPGVLSVDLRRPPDGKQMFFGPFTDIPDPDTYLPLIDDSQYCAPCHTFSFWGTPIYQSFPEWLSSPYAESGVTCQNCHMPPDPTVDHFVDPVNGGYIRDPMTIPTHNQPGASDETFLQNAAAMEIETGQLGSHLLVTVTITNTGAGHHLPTGNPGRHLLLTIQAEKSPGQPLVQISGTAIPPWGGDQAGLPGMIFAKVLEDSVTGQSPAVSYWKQTRIVNDNRIPALGSTVSVYEFALPPGNTPVTIRAELRFRRMPQGMMAAKGWQDTDVIMEQSQVVYSPGPHWEVYLPALYR